MNYFSDQWGNQWDKDKYTRKEATVAEKTLIDCTNCTNCKNCSDCVACTDCKDCDDCENCITCQHCAGCTDVKNQTYRRDDIDYTRTGEN